MEEQSLRPVQHRRDFRVRERSPARGKGGGDASAFIQTFHCSVTCQGRTLENNPMSLHRYKSRAPITGSFLMHRSIIVRPFLFLLLAAIPVMTGCGNFFIPVCQANNSCNNIPTSANYIYVANQATDAIAGFSLTTGKLAALSGSPYTLGVPPSAMATTPSGSLLYVAASTGSVAVYTIASTGVLTLGNNGAAVAQTFSPTYMAVDTTGSWLFLVSNTSPQILEYQINPSTGVLTAPTPPTYTLTGGNPTQIYVTPNNQYVYIGLGTGGVDVFTLNSSTGALSNRQHLNSLNPSLNADNAIGSDANSKFLFVGETGTGGGIRVFTIGNGGGLTEIKGSPFSSGLGPSAIAMDPTNAFVYVASKTAGTIAGYTLGSTGTLTQLSASPFAAGTSPIALSLDATRQYLAVASNGGSPDLQIYSFDAATPGTLDAASNASTGTDPTVPIALAVAK